MTRTATKPPRARRPSTDELERPCGRCGHQNAGHTLGRGSGWSVSDDVWIHASGACAMPGCWCEGRTDGVYTPSDEYPAQLDTSPADATAAPTPAASRLYGPCMQGSGPCGKEPTRPYVDGPRCEHHAPDGSA